jgi:hypothetical protein
MSRSIGFQDARYVTSPEQKLSGQGRYIGKFLTL